MAKEYVGEGVPFLRSLNVRPFKFNPEDIKFISQEFHEKIKKSALKPGDVVVVRTGNPGVSCVIPESLPDANCSDLVVIRPGSNLDPNFLCYYINSITLSHIKGQLVGAIQQHFNIGAAKEMRFPRISRKDQQRIAIVLRALDAKIELNNRINEELEGLAKLLYDYWFVQFDFPITAAQAASMGNPKLEGKPYRASGGKMAYNEALRRDIPEGWEEGAIANFCVLNSKSWATNEYPETIKYVDLANAKNGRIDQTVTYRKEDAPSRAQRVLRAGDTIVGTVRPENCSFAWVPDSDKALTGSTGFAVLTPKKPTYREFNYIGLTSKLNIKRLSVIASGAAYPAVNPEFVAALQIPSPPDPLLGEFHAATAASFDLIEKNESQNRDLAELRDWLLPMLMNGQVTVG